MSFAGGNPLAFTAPPPAPPPFSSKKKKAGSASPTTGLTRSQTASPGSPSASTSGSPTNRKASGIPRSMSMSSPGSPSPGRASPRAMGKGSPRDVSGRLGSATPTRMPSAGGGAQEPKGLGITIGEPTKGSPSPSKYSPTSRIPRIGGSNRTPTQARPNSSDPSSQTRASGSRPSSRDGSPTKASPNRTPTAVIRPGDIPWMTAGSSSRLEGSKTSPPTGPDDILLGGAEQEELLTDEAPPYRPTTDEPQVGSSRRLSEHRLSTSSISSVGSVGSSHSRKLSSPSQRPVGPRQRPRHSITSMKSVGSGESNWSERDDTIGDLAPSSSSVAIPPRPPPLAIPTHSIPPRRSSSTSSASSSVDGPASPRPPVSPRAPPISPRGSSRDQQLPPVSPRGSSRENALPPATPPPPLDSTRRASRNILLGDASVAPPPRPPIDARRRPSHHVSVSELFGPSPVQSGRNSRVQRGRDGAPGEGGVKFPPSGSQSASPDPSAPNRRPMRLSTPPAASSSRFSLVFVSENSPPVPSKNPLRRASRPDLTDDESRPRSASGASTVGAPPTPPEKVPPPVPSSPAPRRKRGSPESAYVTAPDSPVSAFSHAPAPVDGAVILNSPDPNLDAADRMIMQPSYSQDSLSQTSETTTESQDPMSPEMTEEAYLEKQQQEAREAMERRESYSWGRKRSPRLGQLPDAVRGTRGSASRKDLPPLQTSPPPSSSRRDLSSRETPISAKSSIASAVTLTGTTANGYVHEREEEESRKAALRSPSMPALKSPTTSPTKPPRNLGVEGQVAHTTNRSATDPSHSLVAPSLQRTPTSPGPSTPGTPMTKRAHLIREIAMTERTYANDLALIRDAYLSRIRPTSTISTTSTGERTSERSSTYTEAGEISKRQSVQSLSGSWTGAPTSTTPGPTTPLPRSPSDSTTAIGAPSYFTLSKTPSRSSVNLNKSGTGFSTPGGTISPRINMRSVPNPQTPPGKPLSSADVRAVFLNLEQLAAAAEELASEFEKAMGGQVANGEENKDGKEGEKGDDKVGEVFMTLIPKYRQLYTFYCARQSSASARLLELQGDAGHAAYLKQCWDLVRPHTHAWNLDSMLIKPVQRITKYPLLFEDLLACTTPVHPDYFSIRNSAELARQVAIEIDEAKRRKDVVAGVIKKVPSALQPRELKPLKPPKAKGLKLFQKAKGNVSSVSLVSRVSSNKTLVEGLPQDIPATSLAFYRELVARMEEVDMCVRRVGKDMVTWTAGAKEVFVTQDTMVQTWARVVQLDSSDPADKRLAAFRRVLGGIINEHWANLNDDVKDSIMPSLARLLDTMYNPRKVISRRDAKAADYARYQATRDARRPMEPMLLEDAREFVALHHQLVEELPIFMDGFMKVFNLALLAFARSQAAYYAGVRGAFDKFAQNWIGGISPRPPTVVVLEEESDPTGEEDTSTGRGIIKAWHEAWLPYDEAMRHFQTTSTSRQTTSRVGTLSSRPNSRPGSPGRPNLRHANSATSSKGLRSPMSRSNTEVGERRPRASSLLSGEPSTTPLMSPNQPSTSTFKLVRTTSSPNKSPMPPTLPSYDTPPSPKTVERPYLSAETAVSDDRLSFGLPRVSPGISDLLNPADLASAGAGSRPDSANSAHSPSAENALMIAKAHSEALYDHPNVGLGLGVGEFGSKVPSPGPSGSSLPTTENPPTLRPNPNAKRGSSGVYLARDYADIGSSGTVGTIHLSSDSENPTAYQSANSAVGSTDGLGSPVAITDARRRSRRASSDLRRGSKSGSNAQPISKEERRASRHERRASRDERRRMEEYDAAEGWRNEAVLYQCAAVAELYVFHAVAPAEEKLTRSDPKQYGDKRYRKLRFLPVRSGDLIDVFYEVGRVDELPSFPYTEIGVENDGVLVGRAENGDIGLVICSFLEPLI